MKVTSLILILIIGFVVSMVLTGLEIPVLKRRQFRQYIREEGPQSHQKKSGTPTMGGIAIIISTAVVCLIMGAIYSGKGASFGEVFLILIMMLLFGAIGFLDDYIKVAEKHNLGLRAWQKLVLQIVFGVVLAIYMVNFTEAGTGVYIPFTGKYVNFGWLYVPFVTFVMVAMANSVNLTDGLDGLCSGVTAIVALAFAIIALRLGQGSPLIFCAALCGVCLGFLLFNYNPAQLFMGDTGSMALGGGLAAAAILMRMEFLLVIAGLIYVLESLSVIIQVISFQTTGKRVFRMSPLHHHFELGGMPEKKVVRMFWLITLICAIIAIISFRQAG